MLTIFTRWVLQIWMLLMLWIKDLRKLWYAKIQFPPRRPHPTQHMSVNSCVCEKNHQLFCWDCHSSNTDKNKSCSQCLRHTNWPVAWYFHVFDYGGIAWESAQQIWLVDGPLKWASLYDPEVVLSCTCWSDLRKRQYIFSCYIIIRRWGDTRTFHLSREMPEFVNIITV